VSVNQLYIHQFSHEIFKWEEKEFNKYFAAKKLIQKKIFEKFSQS